MSQPKRVIPESFDDAVEEPILVAPEAEEQELKMISATEKAEREFRLGCRFFENEFPEVDECVMVQVKSIADMGAYVSLLEYKGIEGMILLSELSRRRIRSINKLVRVGKIEVAMVVRVDKKKGYIDLSKRRVAPEDALKCEERYQKAKAVHSVMRHVAETTGNNLLQINETISWPLSRRFKTTYEAFRLAIADPDKVFEGIEMDPAVKSCLLTNIRRKLTPQPIKIRADIEVTCFNYEGIDAIKEALLAGEAVGTEDIPVKIKLIAPPLYVMLTTSIEKQPGLDHLQKAIDTVKEVITSKGGALKVSQPPRATSQQEEHALKSLMEQMEQENQEQDGDESDEE